MALDYISYSQYKSYSCPRNWYLSKLRNAESRQTWYIPVGTVVHDGIEAHLKGEPFDLTQKFYDLVSKQMEIEPDLSRWLAGGPKDAPVIEGKALQLAKDCYEKALEELAQVDVWEVEYEATGRLPSLEVPVVAYVDILGEHKKQGPVILDWKTGSTKPDNFQLETYSALLRQPEHQMFPKYGRYVMLAPGRPNTRYVDLSKVDPAEVGKKYQKVYDRMKDKHYEANAGFGCAWCFNQDNCLVNAGMTKRAIYYDKSEEDGLPF
jgi:hypothetical protein